MRLPGLAARTWREACVSATDAVTRVPAGSHMFVGTGSGTPRSLVAALEAQAVDHPGSSSCTSSPMQANRARCCASACSTSGRTSPS